MPQVIPVHIALRSQLKDSVRQAIVLSEKLELLIAVRSRQPSERFHGKVDHSQPPWNAQVAHVLLDLHAKAREMEAWLRASQGLSYRPRGGSRGNTRKALESLTRLAEAAQDGTVRDHTRELEKWIRNARVALDETETPKRLPRSPGQKEPICPWCEHHTLRMLPLKGQIFCLDITCTDDQERRPNARMEYSSHVGDFVLVWQDNLLGVPA